MRPRARPAVGQARPSLIDHISTHNSRVHERVGFCLEPSLVRGRLRRFHFGIGLLLSTGTPLPLLAAKSRK
jgi:hypothetical protein